MATNDRASIVRAMYDAFNAKDMDKLASYAAADAQATSVPFGATGGFREDWEAWSSAFSDANIEVKNIVAEGDYVVAEIVGRGTHTGTLPGPTGDLPATGRRIEMPLVEIHRFSGDKVVELRYYFDAFSFFRQLGLGDVGEARGATGAN